MQDLTPDVHIDSSASLLVLLLVNFFLLELVNDPRWGAIGSTLLSPLALVVAIHDPDAGRRSRRHECRSLPAWRSHRSSSS